MRLLSPQLKAFVAVMDSGTVRAAAHSLGVTQSAVTQRLQALEKELGQNLFLRSRKGMTLTETGKRLERYCRASLLAEGDVLQSDLTERVVVQGPSSLVRSRWVPLLQPLLQSFPQIALELRVEDGTLESFDLKKGKVDVCALFPYQVENEFDSRRIAPHEYTIFVCKEWKDRSLSDIISTERVVDFNPQDDMTKRWLVSAGFGKLMRNDRHLANNIDTLIALVQQGNGYTVLPLELQDTLAKQLYVPCPTQLLEVPLALVWYPRAHLGGFFKKLIESFSKRQVHSEKGAARF